MLLLVAGAKFDAPDPQGHQIGPVLADGLAAVLGVGPSPVFRWKTVLAYHPSAGNNRDPALELSCAVGQLMLVTRGRLAFLGGGDRERAVHFITLPGSFKPTGQTKSSVYGLRVKKDELRFSAVARSSGVVAVDDKQPPVASSSSVLGKCYTIAVDKARVEGQEEQTLVVHCNTPTDRAVWSQCFRAALLPETLQPMVRRAADERQQSSTTAQGSSSSATEQRRELFGNAKMPPTPKGGAASRAAAASGDTVDTLNEVKQGLQERGEKLRQLGEKTQAMEDASNEFANLARELRKQQESRNKGWGFFG